MFSLTQYDCAMANIYYQENNKEIKRYVKKIKTYVKKNSHFGNIVNKVIR